MFPGNNILGTDDIWSWKGKMIANQFSYQKIEFKASDYRQETDFNLP